MADSFAGRMGYFAKRDFAYYATHVCLSATFLMLPYIFTSNGTFLRIPDLLNNGHDRVYLAVYICLLLFFYVNYYYLIPRLFFARKRILYFTILLLVLFFFLFMSFWFDRPDVHLLPESFPVNDMPPPPKSFFSPSRGWSGFSPPMMRPNQNAHTILIYLIGALASLFLSINRRLQASERERMEADLQLLRAQINPHFLFNTLNSIYALAIRKDERTADSVVQLSELMRYIMNNANDDYIGLDAEIRYINNYISLQRSRLGKTVDIDYKISGSAPGAKITPLILISFIENAFKHGVNPDEDCDIRISLDLEPGKLSLYVENKKVKSVGTENGLGLKNTIDRLNLMYAGRYDLAVSDTTEKYIVQLDMQL